MSLYEQIIEYPCVVCEIQRFRYNRCLCDTLTPLAHIWAQGTPKNHIEPRNEVLERYKCDWSKKSGPFFHALPPKIGINRGCRGQFPLISAPKFDIFQVSNGCLWWYSLGGTPCVNATRGPWVS